MLSKSWINIHFLGRCDPAPPGNHYVNCILWSSLTIAHILSARHPVSWRLLRWLFSMLNALCQAVSYLFVSLCRKVNVMLLKNCVIIPAPEYILSTKLTAQPEKFGVDQMIHGGGENAYGCFPCANLFCAPNQKQTFFSLRQRNKQIFFPRYNPIFLPSLWTNFHFLICWTTYFFTTYCWTIFFLSKKQPPPTYHLVGPLLSLRS